MPITNNIPREITAKEYAVEGQPCDVRVKEEVIPILFGFFFLPGFGDFLTSLLVWPFIYVAAFKVRSLPLTLAVIFNVLRDIAIGLIPFWIGDILDAFNRGYLQNCRLIVGFVEDDQEVIDEVNGKAWWMGVLIVLFCFIIYWLIEFAIWVTKAVSDFFSNLF